MCGRLMDEHIDENTGKPFDIQLCSGVCIGAAWRNVTESIKNGVKPTWAVAKVQRKSKAMEYHNQIVKLTNEKFTQKQIAEALGISHGTVYSSLKQYGREFIQDDRKKNKRIKNRKRIDATRIGKNFKCVKYVYFVL